MSEEQTLQVQQGIWIDVEWLRQTGLGSSYRIEVLPGEIRILDLGAADERGTPSEDDWRILKHMGRDAAPGRLPNAAEEHDRYLYGKTR